MLLPNRRLVLALIGILTTITPIAARRSSPKFPPTSPYIVNALARWQTKSLANEGHSHSRARPATASNPAAAKYVSPTPVHLHPPTRGTKPHDVRQRKLSSRNAPLASDIDALGGLENADNLTSNINLRKRRGGEGDNRDRQQRWLPTSDSGRSASEVVNFLTSGVIDNAGEALVAHDVPNGDSSSVRKRRHRRRSAKREKEVEDNATDIFISERSVKPPHEPSDPSIKSFTDSQGPQKRRHKTPSHPTNHQTPPPPPSSASEAFKHSLPTPTSHLAPTAFPPPPSKPSPARSSPTPSPPAPAPSSPTQTDSRNPPAHPSPTKSQERKQHYSSR